MADNLVVSGDVQAIVDEMDPGIPRAVLAKLRFHVGRINAISRGELVAAVRRMGFTSAHERGVRLAIQQLRKEGQPICSTGGTDGGYWYARNREELDEFLVREVRPRYKDLIETDQALSKAADELFGQSNPQIKLF